MKWIRFIRQRIKERLGVPAIRSSLESLRDRGFQPMVVFDVGAHQGEFARSCRQVFSPVPKVYCFEPLASCTATLKRLESAGEITHVSALVGSKDVESALLHEMETASSILSEHSENNTAVSTHSMITLDTAISERGFAPPDLLKIDTQGYELEVLKGIEKNLPSVRFILAELNLLDIHVGVPLLHEVVGWLADRGFVAYDICSLIRRPLDGAVWQVDFLFVKQDDPLRSDKRWCG